MSEPRRAPALDTELPQSLSAGSHARRLLTGLLSGVCTRTELDDALTVASELVNNGTLHGQGRVILRVWLADDRLRIEVEDEGASGQLVVRAGHGLQVVQALSARWGEEAGTGRTVWAELELSGRGAAADTPRGRVAAT